MDRGEYLNKFNFKVFPCRNNEKKPLINDWLNAAKPNPEITGNYGALASGSLYKGGVITIVDLDNHREDQESGVEYWNRHTPLESTFMVETPSGGRHLYFVASTEQISRIRDIGGYKLHDQIDFFWQQNHYIMGVGSEINGRSYSVIDESEPAPLPEYVINLLKTHSTKKKNEDNRRGYISNHADLNIYEKELILREAEKSDAFDDYNDWISMMAAFKNSGFEMDDFKRISWQDERTQKDIDRKWETLTPRVTEATFGSIIYKVVPEWNNLEWRFDKVEDIAIEKAVEMFPHLYKVVIGKDVCIIDESVKDKASLRDYKNAYACHQSKQDRIMYPSLNKKAKRIDLSPQDAFPVWWKNARILQGRITNPDLDFGEVFQNGVPCFNDWERATPRKGNGTTELFWNHLKDNVCNGEERSFTYLKMWIYDLIANPLHRNGVAIAISGNQGCGKTIIGNILSMCFHSKYIATINNSGQLLDKFDAGYKNAILCMLEESTFAGERKTGIWSKMKDLVTSKETTIERKGLDAEKIENKLHFLITSNDEYIVPKQQGDRRYFVLHCNDNHRCDSAFFSKMLSQMENGGAQMLITEALSHREEAMNYNYLDIPETDIGVENSLESAPMIVRILISKIDEYNPENGCEDMPFWDINGEILLSASKLIDCLPKKDEYLTPRKVGKQLAELLGRNSIDRRVPDPIETKVKKCFAFCSIEELKCCITQRYFHNQNVFK